MALYRSESWVINKTEERFLESFEMWCWQRMLRDSWTEFRTNDSIINEIGQSRVLLRLIKKRRRRLIQHTITHKEKLHYRILEGQIESKRGRGHLRITLIKKVIKDDGLRTYRELRRMASNREEWKYGRMLKNQS